MGGKPASQLPNGATAPDGLTSATVDFQSLYKQEFGYAWRTLRRLGVRENDLPDLAHDLFIVVFRNLSDYDSSRPVRPWLFGIAFRVVSAHRRKRRREIPFGIIELPDHHADLDDGLQSREARHLVLAALEGIPLRRRAVLIMHELDDVPVAAVAAALKIPKFTVYSRLRKARRELASALRRMLEGRDVGWRHVFEDHPRWALACSP